MTEWHLKSKRKKTGGIRKSRNRSDKKLAWKGGKAAMTLLSKEDARKTLNGRGSSSKTKQSKAAHAVVSDGGKAVKAKIIGVKRNIANRHFERRQVITKGAIIEVEIGNERKNAIVTSRPGQKGEVQAMVFSGIIETTKSKKKKAKPKTSEKAEKQENPEKQPPEAK